MALAPNQSVAAPGGTLTYSGNPDFRGYIAANAPQFLNYVGNDVNGQGTTGINTAAMTPLNSQTINGDISAIDQLFNNFKSISNTPAGGSTSSSSSGSTGSSSTIDPSVAALLGGQIGNTNTQLGNLGTELQNELGGNQTSYQDAVNAENNAFLNNPNSVTNQYNTQRGRTVSDLMSAKGNIATNVRQTTQAVQKLLGLAGSGTSSASEIAAPYAAGQAGQQEQQGVQTTYGNNLQDMDTAFASAKNQHGQNLTDLGQNLTAANDKTQSDINTTKMNLLSTLAQLTSQQADAQGQSIGQATAAAQPFLSQINDLQQQNLQYGAPPPVTTVTPTTYNAPTLGSYNYGSIGAPTSQSSTTATAQNAPLITTLAQKQNGNAPALG